MITAGEENPPNFNLDVLQARIRGGKITKIFIVCASNYMRSPYSEYYLRHALNALPPDKSNLVSVTSGATIFDREKDGMHPLVRDYLVQNEGFTRTEVDAHVPKYLKRADYRHLLEEADVILAFERSQLRTLPKTFRHKALLLTQFVNGTPREIPDPFFDAAAEVIAGTFREIRPYLVRIVDAIKNT